MPGAFRSATIGSRRNQTTLPPLFSVGMLMRVTQYLPKAYVVNLKSRTDRKRGMDRMLKRLGLSANGGWVEYFPAVKVDSAGGFPNAGARGCFLSHLEIHKTAMAEGLANVVVLEDDLEIAPAFLERSAALVKALEQHKDWGFAYFGHVLDDDPGHDSASPLRVETGPIQTTHFYAVNGPVLPRVIGYLEEVLKRPPGHPDGGPMHVDGALNMFRAQNPDVLTLAAQPNLGYQRSSRSDITSRWFDQVPGLRDLAQVARSWKARGRR